MKRARRWVYFVEILWTWIIEGLRDIYTESWYLISINSIKMFPNWMCFHTGKRVLRLGYSFYFKILEAWRSGSVVPWGKPQAQRFRILGGQGSGRCTKALGPSNQGAPSPQPQPPAPSPSPKGTLLRPPQGAPSPQFPLLPIPKPTSSPRRLFRR